MRTNIFSEEMESKISEEILKMVQDSLDILTEQEVKQEYFRPHVASKYCDVSVPTLERWEDLGLKFSKIRNIKLYYKDDLDSFILKHKYK